MFGYQVIKQEEYDRLKNEEKQIYTIVNVHKEIPNNSEIMEIIKYMSPLIREKLVEYISYMGLVLAQDGLGMEDTKIMKGAFTTLHTLKGVLESLKLSQQKPTETPKIVS